MKHLLNDMSEEEKNNIREQHTGGMKVMVENFNKLINSRLGDSKPLVEQEDTNYDELEQSSAMEDSDDEKLLLIRGKDEKDATHLLKNYLKINGDKVKYISITNCQGVDLSGIDFCKYPNLTFVGLKGTPNNFKETQGDCYTDIGDDMFGIND